ncbi:PCMD domain-containing protein [uncultured Sanguibacteroides sp.]|uniref:PCMD domain-containing protein n=1 Tax=uncultured Sanguibacteroides sp. TaxID=1635151 RepID=UPI0025D2E44A|nr:PCMD domain-containing protein [uncultured Sanguibacteroides sp.]
MVLLPKIDIPAGATLDSVTIYNATNKTSTKIDDKTAIDFSEFTPECYVAYYVTAEDVRKNSTKKLFIVKVEDKDLVYTMEKWNTIGNYFEPEGLTSSNTAASLFPIMGIPVEPYPVSKAEDGAAKVITRKTVSETTPSGMVPAMTAGTLFNGEFKLNIFDQLKSTQFGVPYRKKPVSLKVTYKYTPGTPYYKTEKVPSGSSTINTAVEMPNKKDTCSINAYLYEVSSYDQALDGSNINTSTSVILKASLIDGNSTSDYNSRTIHFEEIGNGSYDPTKKYKLAIVCTPSKDGDQFMGAESTLWIKYLEIIPEE